MTEHSKPAALTRAFTQAWASHDMATAARFVAEDATFDSPKFHLVGKRAYLDALDAFARSVTGATIQAVFGDESQALIMYEAAVGGRVLTCMELLTFRDGEVTAHVGTSGLLEIRQPAAQMSSPLSLK